MSEIAESRGPARERPVLRLLTSGVVRYFLFFGAYVVVALRWEAWAYRGELPGEAYWADPEGKVAHIYVETDNGDRFACWDLRAWRETARTEREEREERSDTKPTIHGVLSELDGARLVALGKIEKRCFSTDGEFMLAREEGSHEFVWTEVRTGRKLAKLPCRRIPDVRLSPDGGGIVVIDEDGESMLVREEEREEYVWTEVRTGRKLAKLPCRIADVGLAPDGSSVVVIDEDGAWVGCWDTRSDALWYRITMPGTTGMKLFLSPCGKRALAVKRSRGRAVLLDLASKRVVRELGFRDEFHGLVMRGNPLDIAFSPCGRRVVGDVPDGRMAIWDVATGRSIGEYTVGSTYGSANGAFSFTSGGKRLAAWPFIIDLETGDVLADLGEVFPVGNRPDPEAMPRMLHDDVFIVGRHVSIRRHPEWWWGHFHRPEVWAAAVFGVLWLWNVARYLWRRLRERVGAA